MSRLTKVINQTSGDDKKITIPIPEYDLDKNSIRQKATKKRKALITILIIIAAIIVLIYVPGLFADSSGESNSFPNDIQIDTQAASTAAQILRDTPTDDFDNDGLENAEETSADTSAWNMDTDGDGATDYYEIKVSDTDPLVYDKSILTKVQKKIDEETGYTESTPFKIGNVIFWAADYDSKANGAVVDTLSGMYRFSNFSGYVQFTNEGENYAYKVTDGKHELLSYLASDDVWKIDGDCTVATYEEPLKEVVDIGFLSSHFYPDANGIANILAAILPDKGFVTAEKKTTADIDPDMTQENIIEITKPVYDLESDDRFLTYTENLNDLLGVMEEIDDGRCVAASLFLNKVGEYVGIIYGYDDNGVFYIADPDTLKPVGEITVTEHARKQIGKSEELTLYTYFTFKGMGFDSANGDRICFFGVTNAADADSDVNKLLDEMKQRATESVEEDEAEEETEQAEETQAVEETGYAQNTEGQETGTQSTQTNTLSESTAQQQDAAQTGENTQQAGENTQAVQAQTSTQEQTDTQIQQDTVEEELILQN